MSMQDSAVACNTAAVVRMVILLLAVWLAAGATACDIPVYQYALENWEVDQYQVVVFHRGGLSATERDAVDLLHKSSNQQHGNLVVQTVDLAGNPDAIMQQRWREQAGAKPPWVAVYYPRVKRTPQLAWAGALSGGNVRALLDSPLRRQIASELVGRNTASWILLESGNRGKDNAAAALLEQELRRLEETLVLPVLEGWGPDAAAAEAQKVRFTLHRLSRDSEAERMLVQILLQSEDDLTTKYAREPMAFPVYGRGLILYALVGAGINEWTITKAAEFITGPCSCEVKADNPGMDMLVALDWNARVRQTAQESLPPPSGMAGFQDRAAEAERRLAEADEARLSAAATPSGGTAGAPAVAGRVAEATGAAGRSTSPRTQQPRSTEAPASGSSRGGSTEPPSATPAVEPAGPPAPEGEVTEEAAAEGETAEEPVEHEETFDEPDYEAALAQRDSGSDDGGFARVVGMLALIAAAATSVVAAGVVLRRRNAVRDEEHERTTT
ncbi:MAG: hypothetical protein GX131_18220 [candidate division WS1 bacterium]|nr:hypothetical protein [candidate division WS1 bacterium]